MVTVNKTGTNRGLAKQWRERMDGNDRRNPSGRLPHTSAAVVLAWARAWQEIR